MQKVKKAGFSLPRVVNMEKLKSLEEYNVLSNLNPNYEEKPQLQ